jgi:3-hydroxybutyryl-CoA dehydrogenase
MVAAGLLGEASGRGFHAYRAAHSAELATPARRPETHRGIPHPVRRVGVVGSGTMATGIAEVFLCAGYPVLLVGRTPDKSAAARDAVEGSLRSRGLTGDEIADVMARCSVATALTALSECDLVVEAVVEDLAVKRALFAALDRVCRSGAILATTTSSLPVIECAMATSRPEDVIGMHFFNPAPVMNLVEVASTVRTSDDTQATILAVCHRLGKQPTACADRTGFLVNALLFPYLNDALRLVQDGIVDPAALDTAMRAGCGFPVGPIRLVDVVGADVTLAVLRRLREEFGRPELEPVGLLRDLVATGHLGRKARRGVREYLRSRGPAPAAAAATVEEAVA